MPCLEMVTVAVESMKFRNRVLARAACCPLPSLLGEQAAERAGHEREAGGRC